MSQKLHCKLGVVLIVAVLLRVQYLMLSGEIAITAWGPLGETVLHETVRLRPKI